jgi:GAF domain-containing protein
LVDLGRAQTTLVVPLTRDRAASRSAANHRQHVEAFWDKQIAMLQTFANQTVIAMENARLLAETRQACKPSSKVLFPALLSRIQNTRSAANATELENRDFT